MIQRIQSLYLLLVGAVNGLLPLWIYLWQDANSKALYALDETLYAALFFSSAAMALLSIFLYKNRQHQFVANRLNIMVNLVLLGLFIYRAVVMAEANGISEKGIGLLFPAIAIVFLVIANKAIKKDEDLVRSVDRLR